MTDFAWLQRLSTIPCLCSGLCMVCGKSCLVAQVKTGGNSPSAAASTYNFSNPLTHRFIMFHRSLGLPVCRSGPSLSLNHLQATSAFSIANHSFDLRVANLRVKGSKSAMLLYTVCIGAHRCSHADRWYWPAKAQAVRPKVQTQTSAAPLVYACALHDHAIYQDISGTYCCLRGGQ